MKLNQTLVAVAGFAAALQFATAGNITGKVTLSGTAPAEKPITPLIEDATCGKLISGAKPTTKFFVVGANKELADVIVVLQGDSLKGKSTGAAAAPIVVDQKGCEYTPQIFAAQTGQSIVVKNSDPVMHNVHTTPTAAGNKEENKGQGPGAPDLKFSIPTAENFLKFKCDVHPWMFAWVTVVDHPYYAISGKDGAFTIKDVPPGKYKIVALHRKGAPTGIEKEIEVTADGATVDFTVEVK
ncbi:MAG: carboxypeptidase regulatory-like domain-containing protein [Verrucomicrobiota bacterium]